MSEESKDKTITCKDCGNEFVFTAGEQDFYKEKGFDNEPVRCPDCRRRRKQDRFSNRNSYNEASSTSTTEEE